MEFARLRGVWLHWANWANMSIAWAKHHSGLPADSALTMRLLQALDLPFLAGSAP